ncbi:1,4-dihydroxy-6-naphthoate synthase [Paenibacillus sophorae]|uniref:1,4-dihydroxy-6-naphtoate synthase n=1 Tax=Paenibacillus sophorae TaxID=1333845 RepID=A0A1H8ISH5_9BACL|nr:1,4-dihydroxy-6-naphthoate synthase [Paenibacillus sophorae]QWU16039.1 1,4-dihydroxy-6-naphthoate synthase [Paenibacillus sophorae]SEN70608.1 1,4-dihydroxy-6-naphthoate synthase [Paenibacillus sophorae]
MTAELNIAYSPCPNDTFVFHAWAHGLVPSAPKLNVTYADIDITNSLAADGTGPELLKISYAALPWTLDRYKLLPCGGALGRGCGPLLLTKGGPQDASTSALSGRCVAVPSERSTAYLLFRLWAAQQVPGGVGEIVVMPFHEIMPAVRDGKIDAGLVIHEARFTYTSYGLHMLVDLGSWWESDTGLPIPLGAIIARRDLDTDAISGWIRTSLRHAWGNPESSREYVLSHAQELSPQVAKSHIDLYVNDFTMDLGESGYAAISALLDRAAGEGLVPPIDPALLR